MSVERWLCLLRNVNGQVCETAGDTELFRFNVTDTEQTTYRLAAASEALRQKWLSALKEAVLAASPARSSSSGRPSSSGGRDSSSSGRPSPVQSGIHAAASVKSSYSKGKSSSLTLIKAAAD